ncbi:MAG: YgjP-like metallopeptidase domain-containing protein [Candidatus Gracilibacteria bacterium]
MSYQVNYAKIKHGYVRILSDGTLKLSIPLRLKDDKDFEAELLEKGKILMEKIKEKNHRKIETIGDDFIVIFGEKIKKNDFLENSIQNIDYKMQKGQSLNKNQQLSNFTTFTSKYLKTILEQESILILDKYSKLLGVPYDKLYIKDLKSKRGSCSRIQKIVLNLKLVHLPKVFLEYVIIHEACHLKVKNHSHIFWKHVESFHPEYKETRKELKKYEI